MNSKYSVTQEHKIAKVVCVLSVCATKRGPCDKLIPFLILIWIIKYIVVEGMVINLFQIPIESVKRLLLSPVLFYFFIFLKT